MQLEREEIERQTTKALHNWEFNSIENIYKYAILELDSKNTDSNSKTFQQYVYMGYVKFLYQIGKFEEILAMLGNYSHVPNWWDTKLYDFNAFVSNIKEMQASRTSKIDSLPKEIQPYYFAYYINTRIKNQNLTPKEAMEIFEKLSEEESIITKAYIVAMIIEYFSIQVPEIVEEFFMPMHFEGKQYLILTFLHSQCDTLGARIYWDKFNTIIRELLQKELPRVKKKLAVAFYGVLRGAWQENLQEILDTTIKPLEKDLEVDCFLFSWDEYQQWSSLMGGACWAERVFGTEIGNMCPEYILTHANLRELLPNVYDELQSEYNVQISHDSLINLKKQNPNFRKWLLETQNNQDFNFYNAKLLYSYKAAFNLIQSYEREKNIEYDYVMLLRSDIKPHPITADDVYRLLPNEIADSMRHFGSGHGCIAGWRESVKNYVGMWDNREALSKNKYIISRSIGDNH